MRGSSQCARLGGVLLVVVLVLFMPACGKRTQAVGQSSPKESCRAAMKALVRLDKDCLLQCSTGTADEMAALETFMDFVIAGRDFREAFVKTYGVQAWEQFQDSDGAQVSVSVEGDPDEIDEKIDEVNFHVEGDTCTASYQGQSLRMTRTNGKWYMHAGAFIDVGTQQTPQLRALTRVLRKYKDKIGKHGVSGEQLDQEMGREFAEELLGTGP